MPPVIVAVAANYAAAAVGGGILGALAGAAVAFAGNSLLAKQPKQPNLTSEASGITSMNRSAAESLKVVYGERRVAGTVVFIETSDETTTGVSIGSYVEGVTATTYSKTNGVLHIVLVMAGHEVEEIGDIYLEDELVEFDGNGDAIGSKWQIGQGRSAVRVRKFTGVNNNAQFKELRSESYNWTSSHELEGLSGVYVRLAYDGDTFPNGIPNVSAIVKGKKVYDPRTETTGYSNNAALCVRDYLTDNLYGRGATDSELDEAAFIVAANICDENVNLNPSGTEKRYTLNGIVDTEKKPADILTEMMTACAGLLTYTGGLYSMQVGAYTSTVADIDESWFAAGVEVETKPSRKDLFNAVKGVFADPAKNYQPTDFSPITNSTYETQDGGVREYRDLELPFTTSGQMAQRIGKIYLEQARQCVSFSSTFNLKAFQLKIGDRVTLTLSDLGWATKVFKVTYWELTREAEIRMILKEDAPAVYDWAGGEATVLDLAPNTNLPNPLSVEAPQNLTVTSGNDELYLNLDGTVMSRVKAAWDESNEAFARRYEVQTKKTADTSWQPAQFVSAISGEEPQCYIVDAQDGEKYDVRVRTITTTGVASAWAENLEHTVAGKSTPPSDVTNFAVQQGKNTVTFTWGEVTDPDLSGYEIRYAHTGGNWENAYSLTKKTKGTHVTSAAVPPGTWDFFIKAYDTSGNESVNPATFSMDLINEYDVIHTQEEAPLWLGTKTGFIRNAMTGCLLVNSQGVCADDGWDTFDTFNPNPVETASYETNEIDLGFDSTVRAFSSNDFYLGANEESYAIINSELSSKVEGGSYSAFNQHSIGEVVARYFKFKLVHSPNKGGVAVFSNYKPVLDQQERVEKGSVEVSSGGSTVTFGKKFHKTPHILLTPEGSSAKSPVYSNVNTDSFDLNLFDNTGSAITGFVNWEAKGV